MKGPNNTLIDLYLNAIDNKNVHEIEHLFTENNEERRNNDIVLELYDKKFLTSERLQFIAENCSKYLKISSSLIKKLLKEDNITLLDIVFSHIKIYGNELIKTFLICYNNKNAISHSKLMELISKEKYVIQKENGLYLINACKSKNEVIVKFLVKHGADINKEDEYGKTPLFYACLEGHENIVKYLIKYGAEINKSDLTDGTPLFDACDKGHENIVKYLIEYGADINKENIYEKTPIFYACEKGHENIVKYLTEHGADINKENIRGSTPLIIACIILFS